MPAPPPRRNWWKSFVAPKWTKCLEANPAAVSHRTACYRHHCPVNWRFQGAKLAEVALELFYNPALCPVRHIMPSVMQLCSINNVHGNVCHLSWRQTCWTLGTGIEVLLATYRMVSASVMSTRRPAFRNVLSPILRVR